MIERKLFRAEVGDPRKCQSAGESDCPYLAAEGSRFCVRHNAHADLEAKEKESVNGYRLQLWQKRVEELGESESAKSLRGEIGILKMLLENLMNRCKDAEQLFMFSTAISDLALKIERLVVSCHKLEQTTGMLLDKSAALHFAGQIVEIIDHTIKVHVTNDSADMIIEQVSQGIIKVIQNGPQMEIV